MDYGFGMYQMPAVRQKMSLTQQQSVHVLQCSSDELQEWLNGQIQDNPLLEWNDMHRTPSWEMAGYHQFRCDWMTRLPFSISNQRHSADDSQSDWWMRIPNRSKGLTEDLMEQLHVLSDLPVSMMRLAEGIIESLDEDGYLRVPLPILAVSLRCTIENITEALQWVHRLEPVGVGARDLEECIRLQWQSSYAPKKLIQALPMLIPLLDPKHKRERERMIRAFQLNESTVLDWIARVDPRPGLSLSRSETEYMIPDAWIMNESNEWVIRWHPRAMPQIGFSTQSQSLIRPTDVHSLNPSDRQYVQQKQIHGKRIGHFLRLRAQTLQLVVLHVMRNQEPFLHEGKDRLKALEMRAIAEELQLHESTISRAVQGKWIATAWGTFPLRMFFHTGIRQRNGKRLSPQEIQSSIRKIIQMQPNSDQCSDEMICSTLQRDGIQIARRTVNKYRHQMGIPCSYERRHP